MTSCDVAADLMSLGMVVDRRSNTDAWRPFIYEAVKGALGDLKGVMSVQEIFEHQTEVQANVAYEAEILFGKSPDGSKSAFTAVTKLYEQDINWQLVSGSTLHTQLWVNRVDAEHGPAPPTDRPHRLTLMGDTPYGDKGLHPRPLQLQPTGVPAVMDYEANGPIKLLLEDARTSSSPRFSALTEPGLRDYFLVDKSLGPGKIKAVTVQRGASLRMRGLEAIELDEPLPLDSELPFNWRPPLVFPPLEGGRRVRGWFIVTASSEHIQLSQDLPRKFCGLTVQLRPSNHDIDISMPEHWQTIGLFGQIALRNNDDEDENDGNHEDSDDVQEQYNGVEDPESLDDADEDGEEQVSRFTGFVTHPGTGLPLQLCPRGFAFTRPGPELFGKECMRKPGGQSAPLASRIFVPGHKWAGSYECTGNPTAAWLEVLSFTPTDGLRANFSFESVTDTGRFSVGLADSAIAHEHDAIRLKLYGEPRVQSVYGDGLERKQDMQSELILGGQDFEQTSPRAINDDNMLLWRLAAGHADSDPRIKKLAQSIEGVYNRTRQAPKKLLSFGVWPVVLFKLHFDIQTTTGLEHVQAVVERKWVGKQHPNYRLMSELLQNTSYGSVGPDGAGKPVSSVRQQLCRRTSRPLHTVLSAQVTPDENTFSDDRDLYLNGLSESDLQVLKKLLRKIRSDAPTSLSDDDSTNAEDESEDAEQANHA
eukprot:SAG31_NODE_502_length_14826_cov_5.474299_3_plen_703_part_00